LKLIQVLVCSDNIMKGFATSLAIVLSFVAGVILFEFQVTTSFLVGTAMVVAATYLYNLPDGELNVHFAFGALTLMNCSKQLLFDAD